MGLFSKKTTEEIQEDNRIRRERAIGEDIERSDLAKEKALRRLAQRENLALKHPKKIRVVKKIGRGARDLGKGLLWGVKKAGKQYAKAQASRQPVRRVRKIKITKGKKKVKRVRKVKKEPYGNQFGIEGRFSV